MWGTPKTVTVQVEANIQWQVTRDPESGMWIGTCPALKLNALGETYRDLNDSIAESMELLFLDLFASGELDRFLRNHNWTVMGGMPTPGSKVRFDTPFQLRKDGVRELLAAHA